MKIVVCVKYVPDTALKVKIAPDGKSLDLADVSFVVNPYDEFAVEEALQIKERMGGEVIVVSAGAERATAGVRTCLAMGADSGVLIRDDSLENADPFLIGSALAQVCRGLAPDLIFFGKHAIGVDNSQVPAVVAELLDLPQVSVVVKLEIKDGTFRAEREIEGAHEVMEGSLPAVFTAQKGLNMPRYASLKGIMAAKKKEIRKAAAGTAGDRKQKIVSLYVPEKGKKTQMIQGSAAEAARDLVKKLREDARVL
jgi:electron transfer flavoprotein beta subunit